MKKPTQQEYFELNKVAFLRRYPRAEYVFEQTDIQPHWVEGAFSYSAELLTDISDGIVTGLGDGYHIQQLLQALPINGALLLIEPYKHIIQRLFVSGDYRTMISDKRLTIVCSRDLSQISEIVGQFLGMRQSKETFNYMDMRYELVPEIHEIIKTVTAIHNRHVVNEVTIIARGKEFITQSLSNIDHLADSLYLEDIKNIYKGKIGVLCAAAPSLTNHLEYLKENQDRLVICGVDAALPVLTSAGITPDFGCSVDPAKNKVKSFTDANLTNDTINVGIMKCSSEVLSAMGKRKIVTTEKHAIIGFLQSVLEKQNILEGAALSVSHFAWHILRYVGCETIILVGNDLCFNYGGKTHADGVEYSTGGAIEWHPDYEMITCNDGKKRPTWKNFAAFVQLYDEFIYKLGTKTFNSSLEGAKIKLAPYAELENFELPEPFEKTHKKITLEKEEIADYKPALKLLQSKFLDSRKMFKRAKESNSNVEYWLAGKLNDTSICLIELQKLSAQRDKDNAHAYRISENNPQGILGLLYSADYGTQQDANEIMKKAQQEMNPIRRALRHVEYFKKVHPKLIESCEWWIETIEKIINPENIPAPVIEVKKGKKKLSRKGRKKMNF